MSIQHFCYLCSKILLCLCKPQCFFHYVKSQYGDYIILYDDAERHEVQLPLLDELNFLHGEPINVSKFFLGYPLSGVTLDDDLE